MTLFFKIGDQMTANKTATATNYNFIRFHNKSRNVTHDARKSNGIYALVAELRPCATENLFVGGVIKSG
jgi:hypothetical protein